VFFDQARIYVKAGDGGNGVIAFRREKYVPRGGPSGGNGGRGGHIYLVADNRLNTLHAFQHQVHFRAEAGANGSGANKTGAEGADLRIPVPVGTVIYDADTQELLADLIQNGQEVLLARGGRAGRGNAAFKSARNKAPRLAEKGEQGQTRWLRLELKLVADVGIIGAPNAGKSTLLSVISAAKPKIADYPFTTVTPNLGVAEVNHRQIVLIDIPGLMEGAHTGVGLGLDFLRHIERTRVLIHLVGGDSPDPLGDFEAINQEMKLFNPALLQKPQLVVFNKMDLPEAQARWPTLEQATQQQGHPVMNISAATQQNIQPLLYQVLVMLDALPPEAASTIETLPEIIPPEDEKAFQVYQLADHKWYVEGIAIERAAQMTNWSYYEAAMRFQRILAAMGITQALRDAGVQDGDTVRIGEVELVWGYENAYNQ
jgi:GTP-binding protein